MPTTMDLLRQIVQETFSGIKPTVALVITVWNDIGLMVDFFNGPHVVVRKLGYLHQLHSGNQIWEKSRESQRFEPKFIHDEAWDIKSTSDGGCIVVAGTGDEYRRYKRRCGDDGDNSNTWHMYLMKFDPNGNLEWQKTYGGGQNIDWAGEAIDITSDGGAIVALDNGKFGFVKIEPF